MSLGWADLLKLPRLLRLGRVMKKMEVFAAARAFRIFILVLGFVFLGHLLACSWFYLSSALLTVRADRFPVSGVCSSEQCVRCTHVARAGVGAGSIHELFLSGWYSGGGRGLSAVTAAPYTTLPHY